MTRDESFEQVWKQATFEDAFEILGKLKDVCKTFYNLGYIDGDMAATRQCYGIVGGTIAPVSVVDDLGEAVKQQTL